MRKKTAVLVLSAGLSVLTAISAFASGWQKNETGWWYGTNADNSTWYSNGWQWIDGNGDGIAECYYFDGNGYIAENTVVDGSSVDGNGAWTVNGVVQTKQVAAQTASWLGEYKTDSSTMAYREMIIDQMDDSGIYVTFNDPKYAYFSGLIGWSALIPWQNQERTIASHNIPVEDRYMPKSWENRFSPQEDGSVTVDEILEYCSDGTIKVTYQKKDSNGKVVHTDSAIFKKSRTIEEVTAEREYIQYINGTNADGTLNDLGKQFDYDNDGRLDTKEEAAMMLHNVDLSEL